MSRYGVAMPRSWSQLLGEEGARPEPDEQRAGMFARLRDSLSKSRRALTAEIASAAFDPGDDQAWERLEVFTPDFQAFMSESPYRRWSTCAAIEAPPA